jgi:ATP-binding cassette, subfamily B, bacterial PglK
MIRKFINLIDPSMRKGVAYLLLLMFFGMLLETMSIALIIPILTAIASPEMLENVPFFGGYTFLLKDYSQDQIIIMSIVVLVSSYGIKALLLAFISWEQYKFIFRLQNDISNKLFYKYITQPFNFHLQRNTAQLIRNITIEVNQFISAALGVTTIFVECIVIFGITLLIIYYDMSSSFIVAGFLFSILWVYFYFVKSRIKSWGRIRHFHEGLKIQNIQESLGGMREVKLFHSESYFLKSFSFNNSMVTKMTRLQTWLQAIPRLLVEFIAIFSIGVLIIFALLSRGIDAISILPIIGVFSAVALRLMPSVNRIISSLQRIRYATPVIDTLYKELMELEDAPLKRDGDKKTSLEGNVCIRNLSFKYGPDSDYAVDNVNFSFSKGDSVGIYGASGSGKSTLLDLLLGLLTPVKGSIIVEGKDINNNIRDWQEMIGYVPQDVHLLDNSLQYNITFSENDGDIDTVHLNNCIKVANLHSTIEKLPQGLKTIVGERGANLSGGQKQRVGIARALYRDTPILVFDEATSALDFDTEKDIMDYIFNLQDTTTVIVSHRKNIIDRCNFIYKM